MKPKKVEPPKGRMSEFKGSTLQDVTKLADKVKAVAKGKSKPKGIK